MDDREIERAIRTRVHWPIAGAALGMGRRRTWAAVKAGEIPVIPGGGVPTAWLREILRLDPVDPRERRADREAVSASVQT